MSEVEKTRSVLTGDSVTEVWNSSRCRRSFSKRLPGSSNRPTELGIFRVPSVVYRVDDRNHEVRFELERAVELIQSYLHFIPSLFGI